MVSRGMATNVSSMFHATVLAYCSRIIEARPPQLSLHSMISHGHAFLLLKTQIRAHALVTWQPEIRAKSRHKKRS